MHTFRYRVIHLEAMMLNKINGILFYITHIALRLVHHC